MTFLPHASPYKRLVIISLLVLILAAAVFAARAYHAVAPAQAAPATEVALELAAADVVTVGSGDLAASLVLSGTLQPIRQSILTADVEGRIDQVLVRTGEKVAAGQVLSRIDTRDLESHVAEQRANLAASQAQLELAEKLQKRNEELLVKNFVSATSVDNSRSTLDANRQTVKAREAQLALARQALDKAAIRSPMAGILSERSIEPGQHVGLNTRLFTVVDLKELEFAASVPVSEVGAIRAGQAVSLSAEGAPGTLSGRVERIAPTADPASRMIPVYVRVANPDERLKGGMIVRGRIKLVESAGTLTLSDQALRREGDKPYVLAVTGEGQRVERRELQLGIADEAAGLVEVKSGLAAGDKVLLARVAGIAPGRQVRLAGQP